MPFPLALPCPEPVVLTRMRGVIWKGKSGGCAPPNPTEAKVRMLLMMRVQRTLAEFPFSGAQPLPQLTDAPWAGLATSTSDASGANGPWQVMSPKPRSGLDGLVLSLQGKVP